LRTGRARATYLPALIVLVLIAGLVVGWLAGRSVGPWPTFECRLEMIVRGENDVALSGARVEITYRNNLYMGETNAAGRYAFGFSCNGDAPSRLLVDAPGYEKYEVVAPSRTVNPLKIALKRLVPPHAPPIVKETADETLFSERVMVVKVPAGERVTLKVADLWTGPGDAIPDCASGYLRFTWIVREPYPDGREDLAFETFVPQGNGQTQVIASGATGQAKAGSCDSVALFNSSLQDYRVEIRHAAGLIGYKFAR
jgi:hypothetical protein